ncbi:unnamed protein product, partial [marine sediment metagenome]
VELRKRVITADLSEVFDEAAEGLAETQKERLRSLTEGLEYDDAEQFRSKVGVLRESYFAVAPEANSDNVDESADAEPEVLNENMTAAVKSLSRLARNPSPTGKTRPQTLNG